MVCGNILLTIDLEMLQWEEGVWKKIEEILLCSFWENTPTNLMWGTLNSMSIKGSCRPDQSPCVQYRLSEIFQILFFLFPGSQGHSCKGEGSAQRVHGAADRRLGALRVCAPAQHRESREFVRGHFFPNGNGRFRARAVSHQFNHSGTDYTYRLCTLQ